MSYKFEHLLPKQKYDDLIAWHVFGWQMKFFGIDIYRDGGVDDTIR